MTAVRHSGLTSMCAILLLASCQSASGPSVATETVCDDGVDEDRDGLVDCEDGDCWETEACSAIDLPEGSVLHSRVLGGGAFSLWTSWRYSVDHTHWGTSSTKSGFSGRSINGSARLLTPDATVSTHCTWSLQGASWSRTHTSADSSVADRALDQVAWVRWGLSVSDGCPLRSHNIFPTDMEVVSGAVVVGAAPWYHGNLSASTSTGGTETHSFTFESSRRRTWQLSQLYAGETYTIVMP